ncbi:hypothetical protein HWV62_20194 [Athelia sp. TMB]|nr:hypothetical protein HWV62_20194 [Athelia sp. TMB]
MVCEELATDKAGTHGYSALARLARTCRWMYEPSMDALWYNLNDISPLLWCFPQDVWDGSKEREHCGGSWFRFEAETAKEGPNLLGQIYCALDAAKPRDCLLPNLRRLHWQDNEHLSYIHIFLSPSISNLSIVLPLRPTIADQSVLLALYSSPNITRFRLSVEARIRRMHPKDFPDISHALKDFVSSWTQLRVLDIPDTHFNTASLVHVARLPNLDDISARLGQDIDFSCLKAPIFPALRRLNVFCDGVATCQALLMTSQTWALRTLEVMLGTGYLDSEQSIESFFISLQSQLSHDALRYIGLYNDDAPDASNYHLLPLATLAPLFSFTSLYILQISTPHSFDLTNEDLRKIAEAWAHLELLCLGNAGWGAPSKVTPLGLATLFNKCPRLRALSIAIDASIIDIPLDAIAAMKPNTSLIQLNMQDSRIGDEQMMATYMFHLVPNLNYITSWMYGAGRGYEDVSQEEIGAFANRWSQALTTMSDRMREEKNLRAQIS